ncbi:MAG: aldehyde dehydrogenase family protein [Solirubrobacterales bacterium]
MVRDRIYAGGKWHRVADPSDTIEVLESRNGRVMGRVAAAKAADVDLAVCAAQAAQSAWAEISPAERAGFVAAIGTELEARVGELAELEAREIGTPLAENRTRNIPGAIDTLHSIQDWVGEVEFEERFSATTALREPLGVVAAICPWNAPLELTAGKVGSALAAGCTVVVKASELAPLSTFALAEAAAAAGLPAGVINVLTGHGPVAGEALVTHSGVDMVSFTGSRATAARIAGLAAETIKPAMFELGGKSASVILSDAHLPDALAGSVASAFFNNGQFCMGTTRFLVPRGLMEEASQLTAEIIDEHWQPGDPLSDETTLGPLISQLQQQRVRGYIRRGREEGAILIHGGADDVPGLESGYFVAPTIFGDVSNDMVIAREEIFGPVICLVPYHDDEDEEAVSIANDSIYGLGGSVWSADAERADRVARAMKTGCVEINGAELAPNAPFGGVKQSGYGREGGRVGIEEYLAWKVMSH